MADYRRRVKDIVLFVTCYRSSGSYFMRGQRSHWRMFHVTSAGYSWSTSEGQRLQWQRSASADWPGARWMSVGGRPEHLLARQHYVHG